MAKCFIFLAILISLFFFVSAYPRELGRRKVRRLHRSEKEELAQIARGKARRDGWLDCKQKDQPCRGFPPCCGDMVCYWESGFSATRPGVCVDCVARGQKCQRDGQCCESLVCQKETTYTTDGTCNNKLGLGEECHDNDQCESEYCDIHWYNDLVMGHGGTCANPQ